MGLELTDEERLAQHRLRTAFDAFKTVYRDAEALCRVTGIIGLGPWYDAQKKIREVLRPIPGHPLEVELSAEEYTRLRKELEAIIEALIEKARQTHALLDEAYKVAGHAHQCSLKESPETPCDCWRRYAKTLLGR